MEVLGGEPFPVRRVSLSGCGRWLGVVRDGRPDRGGCDLWDRTTGTLAVTAGRRRCRDAVVHPSGGTLVGWGGEAGGFQVLSTADPRGPWASTGGDPVAAAALSADGRRLVGVGDPGTDRWLAGWDAAGGLPRRLWRVTLPAWWRESLFLAPAGELVAVAGVGEGYAARRTVQLRFAADGELVAAADLPDDVGLGGLLDDGTAVAWDVGTDPGRVGRLDLERGDWRADPPPAAVPDLGVPAVSPDGRHLLAPAGAGVVLLDVGTLAVVRTYTVPAAGTPTCVAFAPDGLTAACGTSAGEVVVWDID